MFVYDVAVINISLTVVAVNWRPVVRLRKPFPPLHDYVQSYDAHIYDRMLCKEINKYNYCMTVVTDMCFYVISIVGI